MEYKMFDENIILRIDKGEEIVETIRKVCKENKVELGWILGIGAVNEAVIGLFETSTKKYLSKCFEGDYEITSLIGNISTMEGDVYLHLHITLSDKTYKTYGGHLTRAVVSGTCEITINVIQGKVEREFNDDIGLNLYRF